MKRDFDLIRKILFFIEKHDSYPVTYEDEYGLNDTYIRLEKKDFGEYTSEELWLALDLLYSAGFVLGKGRLHSSARPTIKSLTWKGYEYLDTIRDPSRWEKIKRKLEPIGDFSQEAIKNAVSQIAAEQMKIWIPFAVYTVVIYFFGSITKFFR